MTDKEAPEGDDLKNISSEQRIEHQVDLLFCIFFFLIICDLNDSSIHSCSQMQNWKFREHGFEELAKTRFPMADSPDDVDFKKYAGSIKNFVQDANVDAHEKGLEAAYAFVHYGSSTISGK